MILNKVNFFDFDEKYKLIFILNYILFLAPKKPKIIFIFCFMKK